MPSVLLLCEFPTLNGGEQSMLSVLPGLLSAGYTIRCAAPPEGPLAAALAEKQVEFVPWTLHDSTGVRFGQDELRQRLKALLVEHRPDLLHANSLAMGRLSGPVAAELGIPSLAHLRDIIRLSAANIADLNQHTRLLAVSDATRAHHVAQGLSTEKTFVLHNGVDLQRFHPQQPTGSLHVELALPADRLLIGSIGQLVLRKGQDVLAQAAVTLAQRWPQAHYVFVGSRYSEKPEAYEYEANLHATFAQAGIADRAHFLGVRDDVEKLLPELTLLVHAARQEPLGRVLLEAAATGMAIVATAVGGTREIFPAESAAACLVPPDEPVALAAAIDELLADPAKRAHLQQAARRRAEQFFDVAKAAANLARHYREVLEKR
jgi:glycosyltransferase involved in cell wall biosynthesis